MSALPTFISWPVTEGRSDVTEPVAPPVPTDIRTVTLWGKREAELLAIRRFKYDWDGFGADAPNPTLIDTAIAFLHTLQERDETDPPHRVALSPDGLVAMEWQKGRDFLRAEIGNHAEVEWMRVSHGRGTDFTTERLRPATRSRQAGGQAWATSTIAAGDVGLDFVL